MNAITRLTPWPQTFVATGKGKLLPVRASIIIPAGLDADIKRQLNRVTERMDKGLFVTRSRREDLDMVARRFGQTSIHTTYKITLYGYEMAVLYVFLLEQERWLATWWPGENRDHVWRFLDSLKTTLGAVDVYASRPISGNG